MGLFSVVNREFGRIEATSFTEFPNNHIISQDTNLYCITYNNHPWSKVDLAGVTTALNTTVNVTTRINSLQVTTETPGYYSCQVALEGITDTYNVGIFNFTDYTGKLEFIYFL